MALPSFNLKNFGVPVEETPPKKEGFLKSAAKKIGEFGKVLGEAPKKLVTEAIPSAIGAGYKAVVESLATPGENLNVKDLLSDNILTKIKTSFQIKSLLSRPEKGQPEYRTKLKEEPLSMPLTQDEILRLGFGPLKPENIDPVKAREYLKEKLVAEQVAKQKGFEEAKEAGPLMIEEFAKAFNPVEIARRLETAKVGVDYYNALAKERPLTDTEKEEFAWARLEGPLEAVGWLPDVAAGIKATKLVRVSKMNKLAREAIRAAGHLDDLIEPKKLGEILIKAAIKKQAELPPLPKLGLKELGEAAEKQDVLPMAKEVAPPAVTPPPIAPAKPTMPPGQRAGLEYKRHRLFLEKQEAEVSKESEILSAREMNLTFADSEKEAGYQNFKKLAQRRPEVLAPDVDDATLKLKLKNTNVDNTFFEGAKDVSNDELLDIFKERYAAEKEIKLLAKEKTPREIAQIKKAYSEKIVRGETIRPQKIVEKPIIRKEMTILKEKIRQQARGARFGYKKGKEVGEAQISNKLLLQAEKSAREAELKNLRAGIKLRISKEKIISQLKDKAADIQKIKNQIYQYAKEALPLETRGKLLANVTSAKTRGEMANAFRHIINERNNLIKKDIISGLEKIVDDVEKLPLHWQDKIMNEVQNISFGGMSEKTIEKLTALQEFLAKNPEAKFLFGNKTLKKAEQLERLKKTNIAELTLKDLFQLNRKITKFYEEGKLAGKTISETKTLKKERLLKNLGETSHNIDKAPPRSIAVELSAKERRANIKYNISEQMHKGYMNYVSADIGFEVLDGNRRFGLNYKTFKEPFDDAFYSYKEMNSTIIDDYFKFKKSLNFDFKEHNFERIMIHATKMQKGGREKLLKSGLDAKLVDSIELNEAETKLYTYYREIFDELHPYIDATLQKTHNRRLGKVENYFSWQTDFNNSDEVFKRLENDYVLTSRTQQGFTKERTLAGRQKLNLNAEDVFLKHTNDSTYFIHTEEHLNNSGGIARNESYQKAVGKNGQKWVMGWIDLMARKGIPEGYIPGMTTQLLRNIGSGILGFRLSPIVKQPIAKITSAALLGKHAFAYDAEFFGKGLGEYVRKASKQQKFRSFDDPAYVELAKNKKLARWQELGYKGIKWVDQQTADSVWYASYRKYFSDNKLQFNLDDFKSGKINNGARQYANYIVRRTQGTGETKDLAKMLTDKRKDVYKAFLQFQTFILNESYLIPHDAVNVAIRTEKDYGKALGIITAVVAAGLAEDYISSGISQIFSSEKYAEQEREKKFWQRIIDAMLSKIPGLNVVYSAIKYDGTGIPIIDTAKTGIKGAETIFTAKAEETKLKGATRLLETVGEALGISGAGQAGQIARKIIGEPEIKKAGSGQFKIKSDFEMKGFKTSLPSLKLSDF